MKDPSDTAGRLLQLAAVLERKYPPASPLRPTVDAAVSAMQDAAQAIDTQPSCSCDTKLPVPAAFSGAAAGRLYGDNAKDFAGASRLRKFLGFSFAAMPENALHLAAVELLAKPSATEQETSEFWSSLGIELPESEHVQEFLVSFCVAATEAIELKQAQQREAAHKERELKAEDRKRWPGLV